MTFRSKVLLLILLFNIAVKYCCLKSKIYQSDTNLAILKDRIAQIFQLFMHINCSVDESFAHSIKFLEQGDGVHVEGILQVLF